MNKEIEDLVDLMFDTDMKEVMKEKSTLEYIHKLQQENKQLKEEIEEQKKYNTELMLCNSGFNAILTELEELLKEEDRYLYKKFQELKEKYK